MSRSTSILLLGDDPGGARLRRRLSRHFLNVENARTIEESRELARHCRFHLLVLIDPSQPWRELQNALEDCEELPPAILLIADRTRAELAVDALRDGVADVLLRPFSTDELVAAVNAIRRRAEHVPQSGTTDTSPRDPAAPDYPLDWTLEQVKHRHMTRVLEACDGNKSAAARHLGISRKTLDRKLGVSRHE